MKMVLERVQFDPDVTIGALSIDGEFACWTCEDTVREPGVKVAGKTAIPFGTYKCVITYSNRFKVQMPLLMDVPMFSGIRIHPGNKASDTEGCILPGLDRLGKSVGRSRLAYNVILQKMRDCALRKEGVTMQIVRGNAP